MKKLIFTILFGIGMGVFFQSSHAQTCPGVRKDLNDDFDSTERLRLRNLIIEYLTIGAPANPSAPNQFPNVQHHATHLPQVHNTQTVRFLTWHRFYVQLLEQWLLSKGETDFVPLPSWNPSNQIPAEFFGTGSVLTTAPTNGFDALTNDEPSGSGNFSNVLGSSKCTMFPTVNSFSSAVESPHNTIHNNIGGTMQDPGISPGAAIFWPWHAWVDDVWYCYQKDCLPGTSDLYVRDVEGDNGSVPSSQQGDVIWLSPDIWVRNNNDGFENQTSEDLFQSPGAKAFVYVRVWNAGAKRHEDGSGDIKVYWAQASAGLDWPSPWDELPIPGLCNPPNEDLPMGGFIGMQSLRSVNEDFVDFTHNNTVEKDFTIYEFEWTLPDPDKYKECFDDEEWHHRHFCIHARLSDGNPMNLTSFYDDLRNQNNLALKNITIYGDGQTVAPPNDPDCFFFGNYTPATVAGVSLNLSFPSTTDQELLESATIKLNLEGYKMQEWIGNGMVGQGISLDAINNSIELITPTATLGGIALAPFEIVEFCLEIAPLEDTAEPYSFDIIQKNGGQVINGERFEVGPMRIEERSSNGSQDETIKHTEEIAEGFMIRPNPAKDYFTVSSREFGEDNTMEVYNEIGQLVFSADFAGTSHNIKTDDFGKGIFIVKIRVRDTGKAFVEKLVLH